MAEVQVDRQDCSFPKHGNVSFLPLLSSLYAWADLRVVYSYRFALKRGERLGLPIGQHVSVSAEIGGKLVQRSYTPTSSDDDLGHFDLLVKVSRSSPLLDQTRIKLTFEMEIRRVILLETSRSTLVNSKLATSWVSRDLRDKWSTLLITLPRLEWLLEELESLPCS